MIEDLFDSVNPVDFVKSYLNILRLQKMQMKLDEGVSLEEVSL